MNKTKWKLCNVSSEWITRSCVAVKTYCHAPSENITLVQWLITQQEVMEWATYSPYVRYRILLSSHLGGSCIAIKSIQIHLLDIPPYKFLDNKHAHNHAHFFSDNFGSTSHGDIIKAAFGAFTTSGVVGLMSIPCLLVPWLPVSLGHQLPLCWSCRLNKVLSSTRKDLSPPGQLRFPKW